MKDLGSPPETVQTRIGNLSVSPKTVKAGDKITATFATNAGTGWLCGGERQVAGGTPYVVVQLGVVPPSGRYVAIPSDSLELVSYSPETLSRQGAKVTAGTTGAGGVTWEAGPANPQPANCTSGDRGGQGAPTGLFGGGQAFTAVFEVKKPFTAWVKVHIDTANEQGHAYAQVPVLVADANLQPVSAFAWKQEEGSLKVTFDASESYDLDGKIAKYQWDFGDGSTGTGDKPVHQYKKGGSFKANLTVVDDKNADESLAKDVKLVLVPTVSIEDASMSAASEFRVKTVASYQGDSTVRTLKVKVTMTNQGETTPFATLEDKKTVSDKGTSKIEFPFDLKEKGVARFHKHVDFKAEVEAQEAWPGDTSAPATAKGEKKGRILLPVVITHGITGDLAATSVGGYASVGPGLPEMASALAADGYKVDGPYPTAYILVYPSLHALGIEWIAGRHLNDLVNRIVTTGTYADRVDIVAHSMGGLVSRYYIESGFGLNNGDKVRKLVMVGTPNEGSPGAHVSLEGYGIFNPSASTVLTIGQLAGITGATGETNVGLRTSAELLPDYPYYRESQGIVSTTWVPVTGYGYPTDPGMKLNTGGSEMLGRNGFLSNLNKDGLDRRVDNLIIYRDNLSVVTTITRTQGLTGWSVTQEEGPGDATVPARSAIMLDYPSANAQLKKCRISGTKHAEMILDPNIQKMVRDILTQDQGQAPTGCN